MKSVISKLGTYIGILPCHSDNVESNPRTRTRRCGRPTPRLQFLRNPRRRGKRNIAGAPMKCCRLSSNGCRNENVNPVKSKLCRVLVRTLQVLRAFYPDAITWRSAFELETLFDFRYAQVLCTQPHRTQSLPRHLPLDDDRSFTLYCGTLSSSYAQDIPCPRRGYRL